MFRLKRKPLNMAPTKASNHMNKAKRSSLTSITVTSMSLDFMNS